LREQRCLARTAAARSLVALQHKGPLAISVACDEIKVASVALEGDDLVLQIVDLQLWLRCATSWLCDGN